MRPPRRSPGAGRACTTSRRKRQRADRREPLRVVRLIPHIPTAAPVAVIFTDFPGIRLRLGRWYEESLPNCGCDACDEQPGELVADLRTQVSALVEGGLWERVKRNINSFLRGLWMQGALVGSTAEQAFYVLCDASNNPASSVDEGPGSAGAFATFPHGALPSS